MARANRPAAAAANPADATLVTTATRAPQLCRAHPAASPLTGTFQCHAEPGVRIRLRRAGPTVHGTRQCGKAALWRIAPPPGHDANQPPMTRLVLVDNIAASRTQPLARVLTGLGVRMTGRSMSRRLARHFCTMQTLCAATAEQLQDVEGVGPERAAVIAAELAELAPVIAKLAERGVNMIEPGTTTAVADAGTGAAAVRPPLRGTDGPLTVVVTGSVPGLTRNEGNEAVETLGGKSSSSVSKRTDLVVIGAGAGSKAQKAEELGLRTMPAETFAQLLAAYTAGDQAAGDVLLK